ncbi:MAG: hypothetical protein VX000_04510 [Myxococcota bacterium]|nr:hypothetical protein [Myxococcota bacterium]
MRAWVDEGGEGVLLSCRLEDVRPLDPDRDEDDESDEVLFGRVELPAPEIGDPVMWTEVDDYGYAVALFLLVDVKRLDLGGVVAALEEEDELGAVHGVWGLADAHVRLHGFGDMDALGDALVAGQTPPELDDGQAWMGYAPRVVDATGSFAGALTALDEDESRVLNEDGLTVRNLASLDEATLRLLSGSPFGGLRLAADCDEERR